MKYRPSALQVLREQRGLRLNELAAKAKVCERQLRYLERGSIPRADTLGRLAQALGVGVEQFFGRT